MIHSRAVKDNNVVRVFEKIIKVQSFFDTGRTYVVYVENGKIKEKTFEEGEIDYISTWGEDDFYLRKYLNEGVDEYESSTN